MVARFQFIILLQQCCFVWTNLQRMTTLIRQYQRRRFIDIAWWVWSFFLSLFIQNSVVAMKRWVEIVLPLITMNHSLLLSGLSTIKDLFYSSSRSFYLILDVFLCSIAVCFYKLWQIIILSVLANFKDISLRGMLDRSMRSWTELAQEIQLTDGSMAGNLSNPPSGVQIPLMFVIVLDIICILRSAVG